MSSTTPSDSRPSTKRSRKDGSTPDSQSALSPSLLFLLILAFRLVNALTTRTFFQPDEYFQALEPAWDLVFGRGWITWEWWEKLRSIAHPLLFAGVYKTADIISQTLKLSPEIRSELLLVAPKVYQAVFAALGDYWTYTLALAVAGPGEKDRKGRAMTTLFISLGSAFHWFCSTRTFSNSLETTLTAGALTYWPWPHTPLNTGYHSIHLHALVQLLTLPPSRLTTSLTLAAIATLLRPTNALLWLLLGSFLLLRAGPNARAAILSRVFAIAFVAIGTNLALDRWYYGQFTFPPLKFLVYNLVQKLSIHYGTMPWHYYISQGLPLLLTAYLPLTIHEICNLDSVPDTPLGAPKLQLAFTAIFVTLTYSFISHKEMRFLYPLLPIFHLYAASSLYTLTSSPPLRKALLVALVAINLPIAYYTSQLHQRGVIDVVDHIRRDALSPDWNSVGFLMPCHSTPWMSHMQLPEYKSAWALSCDPPVNVAPRFLSSYRDEADRFYDNPKLFLRENVSTRKEVERRGKNTRKFEWPDRLVVFQALGIVELVKEVTGKEVRYEECGRWWNTHWHDDERRRGDVVMFCKAE
ncbi:hypothetical protein BJ508DRAFT_238951 [Ascobolus immersus RN42]|uniref:Mannosyltransferase n=1 Tax=Ascobolus immersus RN42 TaxID=1160509 RepID=A0A3N4IJ32_ASCIM|nr:hypothetical protein BJ508DRAFT_238951 [Ascobolus immersus RN42]